MKRNEKHLPESDKINKSNLIHNIKYSTTRIVKKHMER